MCDVRVKVMIGKNDHQQLLLSVMDQFMRMTHPPSLTFAENLLLVGGVGAPRKRISVFFLLALWFVGTQHCGLEKLGLFSEHAEEGVAIGCCSGTDDSCVRDGCNTVENGSYKPDCDIKLAVPQFVACSCLICLPSMVPSEPPDANVLRRDFNRSDPGAVTWHFVQRAALPARAPSLSLA